MPELNDRFGNLLAGERHFAGLTQEELATAAEVSVDTISKLETGGTGASFKVIANLANALRVESCLIEWQLRQRLASTSFAFHLSASKIALVQQHSELLGCEAKHHSQDPSTE